MPKDFETHFVNFNDHMKRGKLVIHDRAVAGNRARVAIEMATRWGMVQGKPDGEDSAGRSKLDLMSVEEVVDRAIHMTDLLFSRMEELEWVADPGEWKDLPDSDGD